jgi:hypothetical protein
VTVRDLSYKLSSCVLPNVDPRRRRKKPCQDNCGYFADAKRVLAVLFDGHGEFG